MPASERKTASGTGVLRVVLADGSRHTAQRDRKIELAHPLQPDVIVMNLSMPLLNGIDGTRSIVAELPRVRVVGPSMHEEENGMSAMRRAGAVECVRRAGPPDDLVTAIRRATA